MPGAASEIPDKPRRSSRRAKPNVGKDGEPVALPKTTSRACTYSNGNGKKVDKVVEDNTSPEAEVHDNATDSHVVDVPAEEDDCADKDEMVNNTASMLTLPCPMATTPTQSRKKKNEAIPSSITLTPTKLIGPSSKPPPTTLDLDVTQQQPNSDAAQDTVLSSTNTNTNAGDGSTISSSLAAIVAAMQNTMSETAGPCTHEPCLLPAGVPEKCADCDSPTHRVCYAHFLGNDADIGRLLCGKCSSSKGGGNASDHAVASANPALIAAGLPSVPTQSVPFIGTPPHLLQVGSRQRHFSEVHNTMTDIAENTGMKVSELAYHAKSYFKSEEAESEFGYTTVPVKGQDRSIPRRCRYYCTKSDCLFSVSWSWQEKLKQYVVVNSTKVNSADVFFWLGHNHTTTEVNIDGYVFVNKVDDLTEQEREFIVSHTYSMTSIPKIRAAMNKKFKKRDYCEHLIRRVKDKSLEDMFGADRHQIVLLQERGRDILKSGGVWKEIVDEGWRIIGTERQTVTQRAYAQEYGPYLTQGDGTFGVNKYGLNAFIHNTVDCLGYTAIAGMTTMRAENKFDIVKSHEAFDLSNFPGNYKDTPPLFMAGIVVQNRHHMCSERSTAMFDEASWSDGTAEAIGKDLGLCVEHKKNNIMKNKGGLGGDLGATWMKDMKSIINDNHTATELEQLFDNAVDTYGHEERPLRFIKRLREKKEKICHTYMKFTFTHGHSTTQRSESSNSSIKARGELVDLLESATLVGMHELVDLAIRRHERRAVAELTELRKKNLRYSAFYSVSLDESMRLCATKVKAIKKMDAEGIYRVTDDKGMVTFVNLACKILHRGTVYVIFSCTCPYWMSRKKHCKCIVRACNEAGLDIYSVKNIHPIFHAQRHPLWALVLQSLNMEDYSDFEFDNTPSLKCSKEKMDEDKDAAPEEDLRPNSIPVLKSKNYDSVYVPKGKSERVAKFRTECNFIEDYIDRGNQHVARVAIARMKQLRNELDGIVDPDTGEGATGTRPPATKQEARRLKSDQGNKSSMKYSKGGGSSSKPKASRKRAAPTKSGSSTKTKKKAKKTMAKVCPFCTILAQNKDFKIRFDHDVSDCTRNEEYTVFMNTIDAKEVAAV